MKDKIITILEGPDLPDRFRIGGRCLVFSKVLETDVHDFRTYRNVQTPILTPRNLFFGQAPPAHLYVSPSKLQPRVFSFRV